MHGHIQENKHQFVYHLPGVVPTHRQVRIFQKCVYAHVMPLSSKEDMTGWHPHALSVRYGGKPTICPDLLNITTRKLLAIAQASTCGTSA